MSTFMRLVLIDRVRLENVCLQKEWKQENLKTIIVTVSAALKV